MSKEQKKAAPGSAPIDKTNPDGSINRGEQKAMGNASAGTQSNRPMDPSSSQHDDMSHGKHGGNHGGQQGGNPAGQAKGSSHKGDHVPAAQRNQGGGQDNEKKHNQNQPKGETDNYSNGSLSRSSANDGGKIDDPENRDA